MKPVKAPSQASRGLNIFPTLAEMPIPDRLNLQLVIVVFSSAIGLLWLASVTRTWYALLGVGIIFSYVLLTNYALLHEAAHGNLQSGSRRNYWLGFCTGLLFPIPFSMIRMTHEGHHLHNRTDVEMFDLYYPHDNLLLKYLRWRLPGCGNASSESLNPPVTFSAMPAR
jgi:fatty acid desaturase